MQTSKMLSVAAASLLLAASAGAAVRFEDWRSSSLQAVADRAASEGRPLVVVISQPDWCPPCIRLDRRWLKNAADSELASITKDALVVEANGYDEPDAAVLRKHRIAFRGTPTTYVFAPVQRHVVLGDAPLRGGIVGAPDDYPAQLRALLAGEDPIEALARRIDLEDDDDRIARARHLLELGDLHAARGDRASCATAYRAARRTRESARMTAAQVAELDAIKRDAAWRQADTSMLRVRKNYPEAYEDVVAYENGFPVRLDERGRTAYSKAWAMSQMGDVPGALRVLDAGLPDDADGAESFLYFAFRSGHRTALVAGERRAKEALWRFPERRAAWMEALGRIQRRQGRLEAAEMSFAEAASLESDAETKLVYQGQLEHVRGEIAARRAESAALQVTHDARTDDGPIDGGDARGSSPSLGR